MRAIPRMRALCAAALLAGCSNAGQDRILAVKATGLVQGIVYFDANGTKAFEPTGGDSVLSGFRVRLLAKGTADTVARATSAATGSFKVPNLPVGSYTLVVDTTTFGDSILVEKIDSASFTVLPSESLVVNVAISYPRLSIRAARSFALAHRVFITGVALNAATTFADSTADFTDTSGYIRLTHVRGTFAAGDSLRVLGTTGLRGTQPSLDNPTFFPLGIGSLPAATTLTTAQAAAADSGRRDAQLVHVAAATISDTARTATTFLLTVTDSSGPLQVELDRTADPAFQSGNLPGNFVPGNTFDMLGVLMATGAGTWQLRPRSSADLTLIPLPVISVAAARLLPPGRIVVVVGVALNNLNTFSDTTVHLADTSGAIRLTRLRSSISAQDSVKVKAVTAIRAGQPTLDAGTTTPLGVGLLPAAVGLTTAAAASAAGATRDAQLVQVLNATVNDTATVIGGFQLTVSDGTGNLTVLLDQRIGFAPLPGPYIPNNRFNIVGVLVPTGTGTWMLKPRSPADLTKL